MTIRVPREEIPVRQQVRKAVDSRVSKHLERTRCIEPPVFRRNKLTGEKYYYCGGCLL